MAHLTFQIKLTGKVGEGCVRAPETEREGQRVGKSRRESRKERVKEGRRKCPQFGACSRK